MDVVKLRISAGDSGLVPAGRYFERLAADLLAANTREDMRRQHDKASTRRLEERYRLAPAGRVNRCARARHSQL